MKPHQTFQFSSDFSYAQLPVLNKKVFRLGIAGNYGLESDNIRWAAEHGANYWLWGASFKKVTEGIGEVIKQDRDKHIVALLGWGYYGGQIRRGVENALRKLKTDYIDVYKLGWLGTTSFYTTNTVKTLLQLKKEGKIRAIGTSIHNRKKAGQLALDSEIDLFMIRYNAKHPGAEEDIFPYLEKRNPAIVSYTALAWRQLTRPLKNVDIESWPGGDKTIPPLTPALCYRFVLSNPHVHVVLTGPRNQEQLIQNFKMMEQGNLNEEELGWVRKYGQLVRSKKRMDYI